MFDRQEPNVIFINNNTTQHALKYKPEQIRPG